MNPEPRAKRTPLSKDRVLQAAVTLADDVGISQLSMRRLGDALGVKAMSLYKHVADKDDILDGIVDIVTGEMALPTVGSDWRLSMRRRALSAHEVLLRHPWATMLLVSRTNVGPSMLRYVEATVGCLRAAGFSYALADRAWNALDSYVYGFTLQRIKSPFDPEKHSDVAESYLHMIPVAQFPHMHGMARNLIDGHHDGRQTLEFGLDLLLDGLEALRDA